MFAVIVNTLAVIAGSLIGIFLKKGIPERITTPIFLAMGLCVCYIGIDGMLCGENALIIIFSMVLGVVAGTLLDIDGKLNSLSDKVEEKFGKDGEKGEVAASFSNATLLFCVGAMAIVGSINAGLKGDNSVLYTKSLLDFISSILFATTLGYGVIFASVSVFVYQGAIALLAGVIAKFLTDGAVNNMTCAGYIMVMALGLNMLKITKIKIADFLPAIIIAPIITKIVELF